MAEKERIDKVMQMEGMNSAVFANAIGIQGSTLSHILNGRNNPSLSVLQSILNRFPNISPEWLIMGQGSVERAVKQSQTPTLFDSIDESATKSATYKPIIEENRVSAFSTNQQKSTIASESPLQNIQNQTEQNIQALQNDISGKSVKKIIVYYTDNTFQEFETR
jgi:transcriptional regulator with XRE-family HTH domain